MRLIKKIEGLRKYRSNLEGKVGFVPTMGYLHEGHLSLMQAAKKECDKVIVSIFVNPTQFGPNEDFARYPRDLRRDMKLCESAGVDCIFAPDDKEMYPGSCLTTVKVKKITEKLCGLSRPTHFEGVTTVVSKLFNIVQPDIAYFGQKDLQQSIVIKQMVRDLNFPLKIVVCPIFREKDGLALSSRNKYLDETERFIAPILSQSLMRANLLFKKGETVPEKIKKVIREMIDEKIRGHGRIDYIEVIDSDTLETPKRLQKGSAIALAVYIGSTRLIDNIIL